MRIGALRSALSLKLKEGRLLVVDAFALGEIKTKRLAQVLGALEANNSALLVDAKGNDNLRLSARNLPKHQYLPPEGVNLYDVLRHEHLSSRRTPSRPSRLGCKAEERAMAPEDVIKRPLILTEKGCEPPRDGEQVPLRGRLARQQDRDQAGGRDPLQGRRHRRQHAHRPRAACVAWGEGGRRPRTGRRRS